MTAYWDTCNIKPHPEHISNEICQVPTGIPLKIKACQINILHNMKLEVIYRIKYTLTCAHRTNSKFYMNLIL
ncbi:hypothetical protein ERO13_D02G137233v2 [Gossypium hirsutum]|uniref:Uncharacterized protein n=2 Tax=Gossypium TaxID=3633 RepID=A0A0D2RFN8_GOSRA|nr:hypothetical protein ERO13_D02G137233v2 [Gossypium hirsutum]KJB30649.1 hypothetical protein B456_005G153500 [Gossypium raimondii]TYI93850.1 hypothetical protein E1A91_D02G162900v1 [Gossypium mustelinum]